MVHLSLDVQCKELHPTKMVLVGGELYTKMKQESEKQKQLVLDRKLGVAPRASTLQVGHVLYAIAAIIFAIAVMCNVPDIINPQYEAAKNILKLVSDH